MTITYSVGDVVLVPMTVKEIEVNKKGVVYRLEHPIGSMTLSWGTLVVKEEDIHSLLPPVEDIPEEPPKEYDVTDEPPKDGETPKEDVTTGETTEETPSETPTEPPKEEEVIPDGQ